MLKNDQILFKNAKTIYFLKNLFDKENFKEVIA